jgi:hypothetical protein
VVLTGEGGGLGVAATPDAEHKQNNADLGQFRCERWIRHKSRRVWTDGNTGQQVAHKG